MIQATAGSAFEALLVGAPEGIAAALTVEVYDPSDGDTILAASGAGITEPRDGSYRAVRTVEEPGTLMVRWARTDTPEVLADEELVVHPVGTILGGAPAGGLTVEALKRRVDVELSTDEDLLEAYLEAAFLQAQAPPPLGTGRLLTPDPASAGDEPVTRRIVTSGSRRIVIPDAREITEVRADGTVISTGGYATTSRQGHVVGLAFPNSYSPVYEVVEVTGRFGFQSIPANLAEAIYTLAARMYYERDAQYADQVAVAEGTAVQSYYRQLPPRVKLVFASYAVPTGLAGLA